MHILREVADEGISGNSMMGYSPASTLASVTSFRTQAACKATKLLARRWVGFRGRGREDIRGGGEPGWRVCVHRQGQGQMKAKEEGLDLGQQQSVVQDPQQPRASDSSPLSTHCQHCVH